MKGGKRLYLKQKHKNRENGINEMKKRITSNQDKPEKGQSGRICNKLVINAEDADNAEKINASMSFYKINFYNLKKTDCITVVKPLRDLWICKL